MAIEFTCPNGHRLSTKEGDSGKSAKCPKCGAVTKVPGLNGAAGNSAAEPVAAASVSGKGLAEKAGAAAESGPAKSGAANSGSANSGSRAGGSKVSNASGGQAASPVSQAIAASDSGKSAGAVPAPAGEQSIVFLCPNGHKLNAPRRMQGRAGQCPHCGAKFRIPNVEEAALGDEGSTIESPEGFQDLLGSGSITATPAATNGPLVAPAPAEAPSASSPHDDFQPWAPEPEQHPLAAMVMRLWSEREHGGIIELHLAGGAIFLPDWFDRRLSQGSHGLFAAQAADGTVTMTIVPWDTITRVVVRGVVGLPDGMFE